VTQGAIAAGHEQTAEAARIMLREGGNAFDAALAAMAAACVAEPVLASLGGGGFLLARAADADPVVYDFFVQTPRRRRPLGEIDFRPIVADFGDAQQEFHIGLGAAATPGAVKGLFRIHRDLGRLPLSLILEPARQLALEGVAVNPLQHYIATIVEPILRATPPAFALHASPTNPEKLAGPGERVAMPDFAACLDALAAEGEDLFYRGELAAVLTRDCHEQGGWLTRDDLTAYQVEKRRPLGLDYRDARIYTNPAPSLGGMLIGFALELMRQTRPPPRDRLGQLRWLARAMALTQHMRNESELHRHLHDDERLRELLADWELRCRELLREHPGATRGTTQISILDGEGNLASMTLSNGEGCGYVLPGSGIMINNMLGEEDLNPGGFHVWPTDRRIASMMAPSALYMGDGSLVATGSGGSNRIRSAILQVMSNLIDHGMAVDEAVEAPRVHFEAGLLNLEPPVPAEAPEALGDEFPKQRLWQGRNLFFGGAHTVRLHPDGRLEGLGDPRRGGVFLRV